MAATLNTKALKPAGEHDGQKVDRYNTIADEHDAAFGGFLELSIAGTGDVAIGTFGRTQALNSVMKFTGVLTGNRSILMPVALGCARRFTVWNATTGAFTLTIKTTAGGSTGVVVTQTKKADLFHDNVHVYKSAAEV